MEEYYILNDVLLLLTVMCVYISVDTALLPIVLAHETSCELKQP